MGKWKYPNFKLLCIFPVFFMNSVVAVTLQETVQIAVSSNPEVLIKKIETKAIGHAVNGAKGSFLPKVDVVASYGYDRNLNSSTGGQYKNLRRRQAGVEFRQNIFNGFKDVSEVDRNKARLDAANNKFVGTAEDVALMATHAHLNVLYDYDIVILAKRNYEAHKKISHLVERRAETGLGRQADASQVSGRLALAYANLINAKSNLTGSKIVYQKTVGVEPTQFGPVLVPPDSVLPTTLEMAVKIAIANHATLRSANHDIEATKAQHRATYATSFPRLDFIAKGNKNNNVDGVEGPDNEMLAMVQLSYNFFKGGADRAKQKETAQYINQATQVRNLTRRQVIETMQLSWDALQTAKKQLQYFKKHMIEAEKTVDVYKKQFGVRGRTLLDVLNAESEFFISSREYNNAKRELHFAKYRILNSAGALLKFLKMDLA